MADFILIHLLVFQKYSAQFLSFFVLTRRKNNLYLFICMNVVLSPMIGI